jgi:hypothetical protein
MPIVRELKPMGLRFPTNLDSAGWKFLALVFLSAALSSAATIYDSGFATVKATDPLQTGRLSRTSVISDWSTPKDFPGTVNTTVSYHYETFVIPYVMYPFVQISVDDVSRTAQTFASAYLNSYTPGNTVPNYGLDTNYLGDAGNSGNLAGNPRAFQIVMPVGSTLVLVMNDASNTAAGVGQPFRLIAEGFIDTSFSDAPEPSTFGLLLASVAAAAFFARRRR